MSKHTLPVLALLALVAGIFQASPAEAGCQAICVKVGEFCWQCEDAGEETGAWCTEPSHCFCMLQQCLTGDPSDAQATPSLQLFPDFGPAMDLTLATAAATPSCGESATDSAPESAARAAEPEAEPASLSD